MYNNNQRMIKDGYKTDNKVLSGTKQRWGRERKRNLDLGPVIHYSFLDRMHFSDDKNSVEF
jgi:hypothetical protein